MTRFEAPRGTHDILPTEQPLWQWVKGEMEEVCRLYGYRRIDTPGVEDTELIVRTSGGGSDVVQKETYTFADRGGRSLTLRPEGTAPICRAYIEHGLTPLLLQALLYRREVLGARFAQAIGDLGGVRGNLPTGLVLAVQHPERVLLESVPVLVPEAIAVGPEVCQQLLPIRGPAVLVSDAVELEAKPR